MSDPRPMHPGDAADATTPRATGEQGVAVGRRPRRATAEGVYEMDDAPPE